MRVFVLGVALFAIALPGADWLLRLGSQGTKVKSPKFDKFFGLFAYLERTSYALTKVLLMYVRQEKYW